MKDRFVTANRPKVMAVDIRLSYGPEAWSVIYNVKTDELVRLALKRVPAGPQHDVITRHLATAISLIEDDNGNPAEPEDYDV